MPAYSYTGDDARYYPEIGLAVEPGVSADFVDPPTDGRWQLVSAPPASPDPAPAVEPYAHPLP